MKTDEPRRSDRVYLELEVVVSGSDAMGQEFLEEARTLALSRHGAKILSHRPLVPEQVVRIQCQRTRKEVDARIVGQIGEDSEGYYYGIELLDPDVNIWDIEFSPLAESDTAVGRVLLECLRCHRQEVTYLDVFAMEVLLAEERLSRRCQRCNDTTLWRRAAPQRVEEEGLPGTRPPADQQAQPPLRTRSDRKHVRVNMKIDVCIRHPQLGKEVTVTENVSRGGFRFKSAKEYRKGSVIEFALPYSPAGGNIFASARVVYAERLPTEGVTAYGVAYIGSEAPAGMRVKPTS
jgi:PilZ domain